MRTSEKDDDLLDLVYDAVYEPALWTSAIARVADAVGGASGWLSQLNVLTGNGCETDDPAARVDPVWLGRYRDYYATRNPLNSVEDTRSYLRGWQPQVLTDENWMPKSELTRTEFYNGFLRPQDIHSVMWIRLAVEGFETATLNITRPERKGPFTAANMSLARRYQPHLIRAFRLGRRIGAITRREREVEKVLDLSPHGLFLLGAGGVLRHANRAAERMLVREGALRVLGGKLCAVDSTSSKRLEALIASAASPGHPARGGSMALPLAGRARPMSVLVTPIHVARFPMIPRGVSVCVSVTDLETGPVPREGRLRDVFALTGAEARLALALFRGGTLQEAAAQFGISINTARVQLAGIFDKTAVSRQSELIALIARFADFDPAA